MTFIEGISDDFLFACSVFVAVLIVTTSLFFFPLAGRSAVQQEENGEDIQRVQNNVRLAAGRQPQQQQQQQQEQQQQHHRFNDHFVCPVCLDVLNEAVIAVPCSHMYCRDCLLDSWIRHDRGRQASCPVCRASINQMLPSYAVRNALVGQPGAAAADANAANDDGVLNQYNGLGFGQSVAVPTWLFSRLSLLPHVWSNVNYLSLIHRLLILLIISIWLMYLVLPFDLLSEASLGIIGFLDDIAVLIICLLLIVHIFLQIHRSS